MNIGEMRHIINQAKDEGVHITPRTAIKLKILANQLFDKYDELLSRLDATIELAETTPAGNELEESVRQQLIGLLYKIRDGEPK